MFLPINNVRCFRPTSTAILEHFKEIRKLRAKNQAYKVNRVGKYKVDESQKDISEVKIETK